MWQGDTLFAVTSLTEKEFKIRYRNMSLGMFWSVLNPLVMMGVMAFIITYIFPGSKDLGPHVAVFVLCGLVPFNFFTVAWISGTISLIDSANMIKRMPVPRELIPISAVLSNCMHLLVQIGLLFIFVFASGLHVNRYWLWLPVLWSFEVIFVCGLSLITAACNVYVRDMRYVVESANTVLFWLVPIFYPFGWVPARFRDLYLYNPVAALVFALRNVLLDGIPPAGSLLWRLAGSSIVILIAGLFFFTRVKQRFYDYL